jgi:hypothetical protein
MTRISIPHLLAAGLAIGVAVTTSAVAQSVQLPPGISVGPRGSIEPLPSDRPSAGEAQRGGQQGQQQPHQPQQDGPGCTYRENSLELIV